MVTQGRARVCFTIGKFNHARCNVLAVSVLAEGHDVEAKREIGPVLAFLLLDYFCGALSFI